MKCVRSGIWDRINDCARNLELSNGSDVVRVGLQSGASDEWSTLGLVRGQTHLQLEPDRGNTQEKHHTTSRRRVASQYRQRTQGVTAYTK